MTNKKCIAKINYEYKIVVKYKSSGWRGHWKAKRETFYIKKGKWYLDPWKKVSMDILRDKKGRGVEREKKMK